MASEPEAKPFIFDDKFINNANGWPVKSEQGYNINVRDGRMQIEGLGKRSYFCLKNFAVNGNKPFECSVTTRWQSGVTTYGYGLNYCSDYHSKSYYFFGITASGQYAIQFMEGDEGWFSLKPWTYSAIIHKDNEPNLLKIKEAADSVRFYINDEEVASVPFSGSYGRAFGMRSNNRQTVNFEDFHLAGTVSARLSDS